MKFGNEQLETTIEIRDKKIEDLEEQIEDLKKDLNSYK